VGGGEWYAVCDPHQYGKIQEVVENPDEPPVNLVMTRFYTFSRYLLRV
jgi:glucose-1-phosphate thymidylyltransferase